MIGSNDTSTSASHKGRRGRPSVAGVETKSPNRKPRTRRTNEEEGNDPENTRLQLTRTNAILNDRNRPLLWSAIPAEAEIVDDQLFATFFDKYLPPSIPLWRDTTYLHSVVQTPATTALLKRAKRTIGLAHLASATKNDSILRESQVSYSRLLGLLQFTLHFQASNAKPYKMHETMAAMALMSHLHDPIGNSPTADDSWVAHLSGMQQILTFYSPANLDRAHPVGAGLTRHAMLNGLWLALAKRKAWHVNREWLKANSLGWTTLLSVCHDLPGLLENVDKGLLTAPAAELMAIITRLQEVQRKIGALFPEAHPRPMTQEGQAEWLQGEAEEHHVIANSRAFPELFSPLIGKDELRSQRHLHCDIVCLIAVCTILRIWHFRPAISEGVSAKVRSETESTAAALARGLCKAVLSFTQSDRIVLAFTLRLCLTLARNVFEQQKLVAEMGWCDACLIANQLRIDRIRKTGQPSLCKIAQVIPGVAEAGRYGSKLNRQKLVIRAGVGVTKGLLLP